LYFAAGGPGDGYELWKSDGTAEGTVLVKNIYAVAGGPNPSGGSNPAHLTDVNGTLFFSAHNGTEGVELWRSDGTAAGTVMVLDANPGPASSSPHALASIGGEVYYAAGDGTHGIELWQSNGTPGGTVLVKDIYPGLRDGLPAGGSDPSWYHVMNSSLFFVATDGVHGHELWLLTP